MASVRVLVCDDHALIRAGLVKLLEGETGVEVAGEAAKGRDCVVMARELQPDVVLLDLVLPGRSGIEVLPDLRAAAPGSRAIVVSMEDDPAYAREALRAGARGYLFKDRVDTGLGRAIQEVCAGRRYVHVRLGARPASEETETAAETGPLSEGELDVLRLVALGHTNQEVAKLLVISVRTAETRRARIMQKLGLRGRAELVRYALDTGVVDLDRPHTAA